MVCPIVNAVCPKPASTTNCGKTPADRVLRRCLGIYGTGLSRPSNRRQVRVQKSERMGHLDHPHPCAPLLLDNLVAERLHSGPMHFGPKMMFCVIAIIEPSPVIQFAISAHAPGDRFVGITAVMPIVAVQIRQAVTKIPKRQEKTDVVPI